MATLLLSAEPAGRGVFGAALAARPRLALPGLEKDPRFPDSIDSLCEDAAMFDWSDFEITEPFQLVRRGEPKPAVTLSAERRSRRPNRCPKGCGIEGRMKSPDPADSYDFLNGPSYRILCESLGRKLPNSEMFKAVRKVYQECKGRGLAVSCPKRTAFRRLPCMYKWLDDNWCVLSDSILSIIEKARI